MPTFDLVTIWRVFGATIGKSIISYKSLLRELTISIKDGIGSDKIASSFLGDVIDLWDIKKLTEALGTLDTFGVELELGLSLRTCKLECL